MSIEYYDKNARDYYEATVNADMSDACDRFLSYVKQGGRILDAGCGSGRDSLYFIQRGFDLVSIDGSQEMVEFSSRLTGQKTLQMKFEEIDFRNEFDGVWACASLLHVPKSEIQNVLRKLVISLKTDGILYLSFKYGNHEILRDQRLFNSYDKDGLLELLQSAPELELISIWETKDVRPGRGDESWINCVSRKG